LAVGNAVLVTIQSRSRIPRARVLAVARPVAIGVHAAGIDAGVRRVVGAGVEAIESAVPIGVGVTGIARAEVLTVPRAVAVRILRAGIPADPTHGGRRQGRVAAHLERGLALEDPERCPKLSLRRDLRFGDFASALQTTIPAIPIVSARTTQRRTAFHMAHTSNEGQAARRRSPRPSYTSTSASHKLRLHKRIWDRLPRSPKAAFSGNLERRRSLQNAVS
jgi:hypothetical protein